VKPILRVLIVVFLVAFLVLAIPQKAYACSCVEYDSIREQIREDVSTADAIFIGRVTKIEEVGEEKLTITFSVSRVWKGPQYRSLFVGTYNPETTAECGFPFRISVEYIVFAYGDDLHFMTSICSATSDIALGYQNQVNEILGGGKLPNLDNPDVAQEGLVQTPNRVEDATLPYMLIGIFGIEIVLTIIATVWWIRSSAKRSNKS
jgi:hypothetical protein